MKIIVIGLDGASFHLIDSWINQGELPNLKKIKENGVWGDMKSCLPPVTSPNWKCYSTGKNPGKLGIFWWENIDMKNKKIYSPRSRIYKNKELWDYIGETGRRVGILNMPTTYPPKKVNGFMVSGAPDALDENFTYPSDLEYYLKKNYDYKINPESLVPDYSVPENSEKYVREVMEIIESRFEVAKDLLEKWNLDFLHITIFYINMLHHYFWNNEYVKSAWKLIDKKIGELIKKEEYNVIIMSDHGSNEVEVIFNINVWLEKEGYLKINKKIYNFSNLLLKLGINQEKLTKLTNISYIGKIFRKVLPRRIISIIPGEDGVIRGKDKKYIIDWDKTKVLASGQGPIYLNVNRNTEEYKNIVEDLIAKLENLKNPSNNKKIINKIYKKDDIYSGKYINEAPSLIADQAKGVRISDDLGKKNVLEFPKKVNARSPRSWRAENKKIGLFMAYGPDIKKNKRVEDVSILDLAPTILHMFNIPIPKDMDGRVLKEIFKEDSVLAKREISYYDVDEKESIREKVKGLKILRKI